MVPPCGLRTKLDRRHAGEARFVLAQQCIAVKLWANVRDVAYQSARLFSDGDHQFAMLKPVMLCVIL